MKKWEVKQLNLYRNQRKEVLKDISHISFQKLTLLLVWVSQIQSIEPLPNIYMPNLKELYISLNNISSVRIITKASWPKLSTLRINDNRISDQSTITKCHFPQLRFFRVVCGNQCGKDQSIDLSFPSKLQTKSLEQIEIQIKKYSHSQKIKKVFRQKWKKITIN